MASIYFLKPVLSTATGGLCSLRLGSSSPAASIMSVIHSHPVPLVISLFSVRPPQREMAMEGKSRIPSEVLSAPLSTPELPADCGEWLAGRGPTSAVLLLWALSPLEQKNQQFSLHVFIPTFTPLNKYKLRE